MADIIKLSPNFKFSSIGPIPKDWEVKQLIDFCIDSNRAIVDGPFGSNLKNIHLKKSGIPVINSSFVTEFIFSPHKYTFVDFELFQREIRSKVVPGDIVMAKIGARCGSSAIMPVDHPDSILSGNSLKISVDEKKNSTLFVWYNLIWHFQRNQFTDCKSIGAQPAISTPSLKKLKLPSPPFSEQVAIANLLTKWDMYGSKILALLGQKELRKKWLMKQLLTGRKRMSGFGGKWSNVRLGDVTTNFSRRNKNLVDAKVYSVTNSNGFVLQSDHFEREIAGDDLSAYKIIKKNEFAYNPARINVGSIAFFENEIGVISSLYVCFSTKKELLDYYLLQFLELEHTKHRIGSLGEGGVRIYLWYDLFAKLKMDLPSIEEQTAIARVLQAADKEISLLRARLDKLKEQKKGLMQVLLTGKKRLKVNG